MWFYMVVGGDRWGNGTHRAIRADQRPDILGAGQLSPLRAYFFLLYININYIYIHFFFPFVYSNQFFVVVGRVAPIIITVSCAQRLFHWNKTSRFWPLIPLTGFWYSQLTKLCSIFNYLKVYELLHKSTRQHWVSSIVLLPQLLLTASDDNRWFLAFIFIIYLNLWLVSPKQFEKITIKKNPKNERLVCDRWR